MGYRKRRYKREKKMTEEEKTGWVIATIVFLLCFVFYFIHGLLAHCVFEWPIRWDVRTCWNEQINPAQQKAAEKAINFIP